MGEPAEPTAEDRIAARQLADDIVEAVLEDECGPCDMPFAYRGRIPEDVNAWSVENETRIFSIAQECGLLMADIQGKDGEIEALRKERDEVRNALEQAIGYLEDADRRGDWKGEIAELRGLLR